MITHEIQPNLALFELSQITSSVPPPHTPPLLLLSPAALPGSPLLPSSPRIWRKVGGCLSSSSLRLFKSACLNVAQSESQRSGSGHRHHLPITRPATSRHRQKQSPRASLKPTHSLRSAGNLNPYVSMNISLSCDSLQVFKSRRCAE